MTEQEQLEAGIAGLEAQRTLLGDAVVDTAIAALRTRLAALQRPPGVQTLRQVSVLFLDVVNSTALATRLDPESVYAIMNATLQTCSAVVRAHGGTVLQYAGDSLLAAFGTPQAREDDAERAVRCGLALLPLGQALGARVLQEHGHAGCHVRVGIHTGPVLLGGGVEEAGTIRGATVHRAARMEQTAPPGALRISQATWRHVRGAFDMTEQPPLQVKGESEPLRTWLVQAERPRAFRVPARGVEGLETAMVGRDPELAQLLAAFDQVVQTRQPLARTVLADAGLGKSRLMHELQHALDGHPQPFWLLLGRASAGGLLQPYGLMRELVAWRLQIADSDSADTARGKLMDGLLPWLLPPHEAPSPDERDAARGQAELLGQLIGMDFSASAEVTALLAKPRQLRDSALGVFRHWLQAMAQRSGHPLVMLLDDLQWADDASLDALLPLLVPADGEDLPLLAVMAARPSLIDRRADWGQAPAGHQTLALAELRGADQAALTQHLLARLPDPPPSLLALIDRHAAGNPFYAEELVKMFIDDGVIEVGADAWTCHAERLQPDQVPPTLTGVLQARLDALREDDRRALQWASVVGAVFWDEALGSLDPHAPEALPTLQERALVHARPESLFADTAERAFQHHLLHQVTYDTVLKAERQAGHARAAAWLAARVGERSAEYMAVVAEHHERAGDTARAFDWYEKAVNEAKQRFAQSAVVAHARRAAALPPPTDLRRLQSLLAAQVYACDLLGWRDEQARVLDRRLELATALGDEAQRAGVLGAQALLADRVGDFERASRLALEGVALAEAVGAAEFAALCWGELAWLSHLHNDAPQALSRVKAGLVWARRAREADVRDARYEMQLLVLLSHVQGTLNQHAERRQTLLTALALAQAGKELRTEFNCLSELASMAVTEADDREAERYAGDLQDRARSMQFTEGLASSHALLASAAELRHDPARMLQEADSAHALYVRTGSRLNQAYVLLEAAVALLDLGRPAEALQRQQQALVSLESAGEAPQAHACRVLMARAQLDLGQPAEALRLVDAHLDGLDGPDTPQATTWTSRARIAAWEVLQATGDPRAPGQLQLARQHLASLIATLPDATVRARVLSRVRRFARIAAACREAGMPVD